MFKLAFHYFPNNYILHWTANKDLPGSEHLIVELHFNTSVYTPCWQCVQGWLSKVIFFMVTSQINSRFSYGEGSRAWIMEKQTTEPELVAAVPWEGRNVFMFPFCSLRAVVVAPMENVTQSFQFDEEWGGADFCSPRDPAFQVGLNCGFVVILFPPDCLLTSWKFDHLDDILIHTVL